MLKFTEILGGSILMHEYLMSLFQSVRILFRLASFVIVLVNIYWLYHIVSIKWHGEKIGDYAGNIFPKNNKIILACEAVMLLGFICSPRIFSKFENTNIGSFLEKEVYEEQYYVYIRRDAEKSKSYKVKAVIIKRNYGHPLTTDDGDWTFKVDGNGYFLKKIYWDNGGYLTFLDDDDVCELESNSPARLYPFKEKMCEDKKDDLYYIYLSAEKVNK